MRNDHGNRPAPGTFEHDAKKWEEEAKAHEQQKAASHGGGPRLINGGGGDQESRPPFSIDFSLARQITGDLRPRAGLDRILGDFLARKKLSILAGSGGVSKSTFVAGLMMQCTGGAIALGLPVHLRNKRRGTNFYNVSLLALEDDQDTVDRSLRAAMDQHKTAPRGGFWAMGKETFKEMCGGQRMRPLLIEPVTGAVSVNEAVIKALRIMIARLEIDVLVLDPMKDVYGGMAMGNEAMNVLYEALADLAITENISLLCVVHTRKPSGAVRTSQDQHDIKHGSEAPDTARAVINLNAVSAKEKTEDLQIDPGRNIVKASVTKSNIGPKNSTYYEVITRSVQCANGDNDRTGVAIYFDAPTGQIQLQQVWPYIREAVESEFVFYARKARSSDHGTPLVAVIKDALEDANLPASKAPKVYDDLIEKRWIGSASEENPRAKNPRAVDRAKVGENAPE